MPSTAVRRSALESTRAPLAVPREAAREAPPVSLAEIGPYDKLLVLGAGSAEAVGGLLGTDGTPQPQSVQVAMVLGRQVEAWLIGPGETLLLLEAAGPPVDGAPADVAARIGEGVSVVDVGSAWTALRLDGPAAPAVLAELLTVDVDPRSFAEGSLVQGPLAGVRSIVARGDMPAGPGYAILVARDYAMYCWDAMIEVGEAHGLVGNGATRDPGPRAAQARR